MWRQGRGDGPPWTQPVGGCRAPEVPRQQISIRELTPLPCLPPPQVSFSLPPPAIPGLTTLTFSRLHLGFKTKPNKEARFLLLCCHCLGQKSEAGRLSSAQVCLRRVITHPTCSATKEIAECGCDFPGTERFGEHKTTVIIRNDLRLPCEFPGTYEAEALMFFSLQVSHVTGGFSPAVCTHTHTHTHTHSRPPGWFSPSWSTCTMLSLLLLRLVLFFTE